MRPVNLIPADDAGAARGRRGRRGGGLGAYALLGALAVLVAMSALYAFAGRSMSEQRRSLAAVTAQADATEAKAGSLKQYADFANTRKARVETVQNLLDSRIDWSQSLREVARTLPSGTWVTSLRATASPSVSAPGTGDPLRAAVNAPAIEAIGCARTQSRIAAAMVALRSMAGVQRVSLSDATKSGDASPTGTTDSATAGGAGECAGAVKFSMTIFFEARTSSATSAGAAAGGTTP
jgi:Tfp pilus assembly protein PilN